MSRPRSPNSWAFLREGAAKALIKPRNAMQTRSSTIVKADLTAEVLLRVMKPKAKQQHQKL
jgi:hypothetical protein